MVNVNVHGLLNRGGFAKPRVEGEWDLGGGFFGGFHTGVHLPVQDDLTILGIPRNFASSRLSAPQLSQGWLESNLHGHFRHGAILSSIYSAPGSYAPDFINVDLTATYKFFGKYEVGLIAFGSADLDAPVPGYAKQSQFAVGGLVGYDFGTIDLQIKYSHDVSQANYGGYDFLL